MKKYAIVEKYMADGSVYWVAYKYTLRFKLFGASRHGYIQDSISFHSIDICI